MLKDRRFENPEARRRLGALKPMKAIIMLFLKIMSSLAPKPSDDRDAFEIWLNELWSKMTQMEIERNPWTAPKFKNIQRTVMAVIETDKPYRDATLALVALIRAEPNLPYSDDDKIHLKHMGIEVI